MDGEDVERDEVKEGGKTKKEREREMHVNIYIYACVILAVIMNNSIK
mgnify:CR=1 FL=1